MFLFRINNIFSPYSFAVNCKGTLLAGLDFFQDKKVSNAVRTFQDENMCDILVAQDVRFLTLPAHFELLCKEKEGNLNIAC